MTMVAAKPQATAGTAPVRTAGARGVVPVPPAAPPGRSRRTVPLTPMRQQAAKSMRKLAEGIQRDHPELAVHDHVRDAARTLESGNEEASQRHLRAAMFSLTPHSLMRNGVHDDEGHISARQAVHGVHRHLLLVKDIVDVAAKNQAAIRRDSYGDYESGPSLPHADPNAGYGPGALAAKPTQRQPGGNRALNAPDRTNSGGSDPAVADPVGPQPKGSKQFATWNEVAAVVELAARDGAHVAMQDFQNRGDRLRAELGIDGTAGDAQDVPHAFMPDTPGGLCLACGLAASYRKHGQTVQTAYSWDDLAAVIELSAETGRLAVTPHPLGKKGLWHVAGMELPPYVQNIAHALLRTGRAKTVSQAVAMARAATERWEKGGGHVRPEVRAAAAASDAQWQAKRARAHAQ